MSLKFLPPLGIAASSPVVTVASGLWLIENARTRPWPSLDDALGDATRSLN
jgi:hypothetical protein